MTWHKIISLCLVCFIDYNYLHIHWRNCNIYHAGLDTNQPSQVIFTYLFGGSWFSCKNKIDGKRGWVFLYTRTVKGGRTPNYLCQLMILAVYFFAENILTDRAINDSPPFTIAML